MSLYVKIRQSFLIKNIQQEIVDTILDEFKEMKKCAFKRDVVLTLLHAAKFSDLSLAFVDNYINGNYIDINNIQTGKLIQDLINRKKTSPEEVILTLAIPRAVDSIHTVRNKKDVAHVKSIDPDFFDIFFCETSCDWILSQFICLVYGANASEAKKIINQICEKKVPWLQEFDDGSLFLLVTDRPLKDQILLVLYHQSTIRMNAGQISEILQYDNFTYIGKLLEDLNKDKLVHKRSLNFVYMYIISDLGIKEAEKILEEIRVI